MFYILLISTITNINDIALIKLTQNNAEKTVERQIHIEFLTVIEQ
jgi:hypothetical protein